MAKPEDITRSHHRTTAEIKQAHPWISERAQELREVFGKYAGLVVTEDEPVFSWEREEAYKVPTNTILDRHGNYIKPPVGTFWNAGIDKKGRRK